MSWTDSKSKCEEEKGTLASVEDEETNSFLQKMITKNAFIGGHKQEEWKWSDDKEFDFENFHPEADDSESYVEMVYSQGSGESWWNKVSETPTHDHGFICKLNPSATRKKTFLLSLGFNYES